MENVSRINDFLNETGVFFLATEDEGQPRLRPLGMHLMIEGKLYFGIGDFKNVYRQLRKNPRCEIAAVKKDGHWLRYTGTAVFEDDPKYAEAALEAAPHLRKIYNEESGFRMMIFRLENATAVDIAVMGPGVDLMN